MRRVSIGINMELTIFTKRIRSTFCDAGNLTNENKIDLFPVNELLMGEKTMWKINYKFVARRRDDRWPE